MDEIEIVRETLHWWVLRALRDTLVHEQSLEFSVKSGIWGKHVLVGAAEEALSVECRGVTVQSFIDMSDNDKKLLSFAYDIVQNTEEMEFPCFLRALKCDCRDEELPVDYEKVRSLTPFQVVDIATSGTVEFSFLEQCWEQNGTVKISKVPNYCEFDIPYRTRLREKTYVPDVMRCFGTSCEVTEKAVTTLSLPFWLELISSIDGDICERFDTAKGLVTDYTGLTFEDIHLKGHNTYESFIGKWTTFSTAEKIRLKQLHKDLCKNDWTFDQTLTILRILPDGDTEDLVGFEVTDWKGKVSDPPNQEIFSKYLPMLMAAQGMFNRG